MQPAQNMVMEPTAAKTVEPREEQPRAVEPMSMENVNIRGGGAGADICCGLCAGIACFECCECCC